MTKLRYPSRRAWLFMSCAMFAIQAAEVRGASKEDELIAVLQTGAPADKAIACKQLAIHGGQAAVPELAKLLADEKLASWARIALEAIPDAAADEALLKATDRLSGKLLVGTINSIGVRRDANAAEALTKRLTDADSEVASAAAVALGRIANDAAAQALRNALKIENADVRNAVAEGCILCAERLWDDGKAQEAMRIYDDVRKADVPKQRKIEATRGAILVRNTDGIPLLIEQLNSADKAFVYIALAAARELPGRGIAEALGEQLAKASPERSVLLLHALAERRDFVVSPAVVAAAKKGPAPVRLAAIGVVGRSGNASHLATLLEIAAGSDAELAQAARSALANLPGDDVDADIAARLSHAEGGTLGALIEAVGERRIPATAALVASLDNSDSAIRRAALAALGETVGPGELSVLIAPVLTPKNAEDAAAAEKALTAACVRMPDRQACSEELTAAMERATTAKQAVLLRILGGVGGPKSLETIAAAMKSGNDELQDAGSRVLGEWMSVEAAPVLLDLAKDASSDKYRVRALRGYIRLARQFEMSDEERAKMCQEALDAAQRAEEQQLTLAVLERYPSAGTLAVAIKAIDNPALKDDARRVALEIVPKLGSSTAEVADLLAKIGLKSVKLEIVKAEYGAGGAQKDVTDLLKKQVRDLCLISLPAGSYNESFGGDPAPGVPKTLSVQYRVNGKEGEASFAENALVLLPMPK